MLPHSCMIVTAIILNFKIITGTEYQRICHVQ